MAKKEFDKEALKRACEQCDKNITIFEEAIAKEYATKVEYRRMIRFLDEQEAKLIEAKAIASRVQVVKVDEDTED